MSRIGYGVIIGEGAAHKLLDNVTGATVGDASHLIAAHKTFQLSSGTGTVAIEGSLDGIAFVPIRDTVSGTVISLTGAAPTASNNEPWKYVRANASAATGATVLAGT